MGIVITFHAAKATPSISRHEILTGTRDEQDRVTSVRVLKVTRRRPPAHRKSYPRRRR